LRSGLRVRAIPAALLAAGIAFAAPVAAGAASSVATTAAWTQYQGDSQHTGVATSAPSPPYRVAWRAQTGIGDETHFAGIPAPVIADGQAIVVDRDDVSALSVATGAVSWTIPRKLGPSAPAAVVPRTDGGTTIVYTEGGGDLSSSASGTPTPSASVGPSGSNVVHSTLVAVDGSSRHELWGRDLPAVSVSGPTVDGDVVMVGTNDGSVTAVSLASGKQEWTVDLGDSVNTPVVAADGVAYAAVTSDPRQAPLLVALRETDGSVVWRYSPASAGSAIGAPTVSDGTVFVTVSDASVHAVEATTGTPRWAAKLNTVSGGGAPAVSSDAVVVVDIRGQVYRFDPVTGERTWDFAMNVPVYASSAIAGRSVVVGDSAGDVSAMDLQTGERIWRQNVGDGLVLGLAVTSDAIVVARTGPSAGLVTLVADPSGVLIREQSPTIIRPLALLLAWVVAAIPLVLVLILAGRFLDARLGSAQFDAVGADPTDPLEDDLV
jgi:outer membrane protein assembly factor BamB